MKSLVFDTGPIISLTLTHLIWILEPLKKHFGGNFLITQAVKEELVDRPLATRKFKFEALYTESYIKKGTVEIFSQYDYKEKSNEIMELANNMFMAKGSPIKIIHEGEAEVLGLATVMNPMAVVVDERTTLKLIEDPWKIKEHLEARLHTNVRTDKKIFDGLHQRLASIKVIRSVELVLLAFELGILDMYLPDGEYPEKDLLDSILWGLKLNGCSIQEEDLAKIIELETS